MESQPLLGEGQGQCWGTPCPTVHKPHGTLSLALCTHWDPRPLPAPPPSHSTSVRCPGLICKPIRSSSSVFAGEYKHPGRHEFVKGTEVWVTVVWALDEQEWQENLA